MSIKRWTAYVEDDDGNDVFVAHTPDLLGSWVRHGDHVAEVEELRAVRRALVRDNRDKTNTIRELQARVRELEAALRPIIEDDLGALPKAVLDLAVATLAAVSAETAPWTPVDFGSVEEHAQRAGRPSARKETTVSDMPWFDMTLAISVEAPHREDAESILIEVRRVIAENLPSDYAWCVMGGKIERADDE